MDCRPVVTEQSRSDRVWRVLSIDDLGSAVNVHLLSNIEIEPLSISPREFLLQVGSFDKHESTAASVGADFSRFHVDLKFEVDYRELGRTDITIFTPDGVSSFLAPR